MKCPNCDGPLIAGEVYFKKSGADFLSSGVGSEDLRMRCDTGADFILLGPSEKTAAQFCIECGVAVIASEKGRRPAIRRTQSPQAYMKTPNKAPEPTPQSGVAQH